MSEPDLHDIAGMKFIDGGEVGEVGCAFSSAGIEFTNGDQPGVRLTNAAAARSAEGSVQNLSHI